MIYKLGKLPAQYNKCTLKLSSYLDLPKLPPLPPDGPDWFAKVSKFNMAGNADYRNCVCAGAAHMRQAWTANAGRHEVITPDKIVISQYLKLTGGQDFGLNMLSVLNYWRQTGLFGDKIGAFVSVNPRKITQISYANYLFGGVYIGLMLPKSIQGQKIWDVPPGGPVGDGEPDSLGGHCVTIGVARPSGLVVSTWGMKQPMTLAFLTTYCDEAYALLSLDWFDVNHKSPPGFAYRDLLSDLAQVTK